MASTTLMTFLVCTNPNVKTVQLLGSWDNFSKPYAMERDKRVGGGQWRGCHTFTDIISDGSSHGPNTRSSGLKMGSTYWYYYLLDHNVEYYNEAEPVTTKCPSLPGQPVNVLHVPIVLPDSRAHGRDGSVGSEKSSYRTMNPDDKYLNPRPPPKPKARLRTSPTLPWFSEWPFRAPPQDLSNRSTSQPASPTRAKGDRGRDRSNPKGSLSPKFDHVPATTWHLNPSLPSSKDGSHRDVDLPKSSISGRDQCQTPGESEPHLGSASSATAKVLSQNPDKLSFLQSTSVNNSESTLLPIQYRRALKSSPRDGSPNGNGLTIETQSRNGSLGSKHAEATKRSPTTKGFIPRKRLPLILNTAKKLGAGGYSTSQGTINLKEKRLPTLPNSPSSVMDEALRDLDSIERALDMEMLGSHFSEITMTEGSTPSDSPCERSHFSKWSTDSDVASPESMTSTSTFNVESDASPIDDVADGQPSRTPVPRDYCGPQTSRLAVDSEQLSPGSTAGVVSMYLSLPHLSGSSHIDIPDLYVDDTDQVESNPKRYAAVFGPTESINGLGLRSPDASSFNESDQLSSAQVDRRSSIMYDLMDELSYLRSSIELGTGGRI